MVKRRNLSPVELTATVLIVVLAAVLAWYCVDRYQDKARAAKVAADVNALIKAVQAYRATYGVLPLVAAPNWKDPHDDKMVDLRIGGTPATDTQDERSRSYDRLIQWLAQAPTGTVVAAGGEAVDKTGNVRKIKFLSSLEQDGKLSYIDPWGNRYVIVMDANNDNKMLVESPEGTGTKMVDGIVYAYSKGPGK